MATFVQSDIRQLHFVLAVLILSLHQHEAQKPFGRGERGGDGTDGRSGGGGGSGENNALLHRLEMWSLLVLLFLLWCGIYFFISSASNDGLCVADAGACTLLVLGVLGSNVVYVFVVSLRCCSAWGKRNRLHGALHRRVSGIASRFGLRRSNSRESQAGTTTEADKSCSLKSNPLAQRRRPQRQQNHPSQQGDVDAVPEIEMRVNPMRRKKTAGPELREAVGVSVVLEEKKTTAARARSGSYTRHYSNDGKEFFVNDDTGESVWSVPVGGTVAGDA